MKKIIGFVAALGFGLASFAGLATAESLSVLTGSTTGVFYSLGKKTCVRAKEDFVTCQAVESGGSNFNVDAVKEASQAGINLMGLAMKPVAVASGLSYKELRVGEGSFITATKETSDTLLKRIGADTDEENKVAVYSAALKLAKMGRVQFVTIGAGSGDTKIMKEQLTAAGAPESALIVASNQDDFILKVKTIPNVFGYFNRIPVPSNSIFVAITENDLDLLGAYNPAFKDPSTTTQVVEVGGFTVKTKVTPVTIVYTEGNSDVGAVVAVAQKIALEDLVPKEKGEWYKNALKKLKKFGAKMSEMSGPVIADIDKKITDLVNSF